MASNMWIWEYVERSLFCWICDAYYNLIKEILSCLECFFQLQNQKTCCSDPLAEVMLNSNWCVKWNNISHIAYVKFSLIVFGSSRYTYTFCVIFGTSWISSQFQGENVVCLIFVVQNWGLFSRKSDHFFHLWRSILTMQWFSLGKVHISSQIVWTSLLSPYVPDNSSKCFSGENGCQGHWEAQSCSSGNPILSNVFHLKTSSSSSFIEEILHFFTKASLQSMTHLIFSDPLTGSQLWLDDINASIADIRSSRSSSG